MIGVIKTPACPSGGAEAKTAYNGKVPAKDIAALEHELHNLQHGAVSLTIFVRGGRFQYSRLVKEYTRSGVDDEQPQMEKL